MRGKLTEFFNKLKTKKIVEEYRIVNSKEWHNYIAASFLPRHRSNLREA